MSESIIRFEKVNKWYGNEFHVLRDIDLSVDKGERIVICGPSGSGKSTLIRCVNALEPYQEGLVTVDGTALTDDNGDPVTQEVPFVGIGPAYERVPQAITAVPALTWDALVQTVGVVASIPQQVVDAWQAATGVEERGDGVMSLVGVGRIAGEITSVQADVYTTSDRVADLLGLLASLNIALFVFNLIPLPPLDGGHVAGALWEGLRRRVARWRNRPDPGPADVARAIPVAYGVVVALIGVSLVFVYADIVAPVTLGG